MRPAEFTTDAIIAAGLDLRTAGRNITGFALRQKVGGGNPNRLRQVWEEYLASQSATTAQPVAALPVEVAQDVAAVTKALAERIAALAVELNDKAVKAAEQRVSAVLRSAGEQRAQAERELADAAQTVEDLEATLDTATTTAATQATLLQEAQTLAQGYILNSHLTQLADAVHLNAEQDRMICSNQQRLIALEKDLEALQRQALSILAS